MATITTVENIAGLVLICGVLTFCCRARQLRPSSRYKHANTPHTSSMMSSTLKNVYLVDASNTNVNMHERSRNGLLYLDFLCRIEKNLDFTIRGGWYLT